jgi:heat shock protein HtpX
VATFYDQIGANRRNSVLLALSVTAILGVLGLLIGWALTGDPRAAIPSTLIAIGLGLVASLVSYFMGDSIVLGVSGAKEVDERTQPELLNVVREMSLAANVPTPRPMPSPPGATPSTRPWRSPSGCSRSSTGRSSRA